MYKPKEIKIRLSKRELKEALKKASSRKSIQSKYKILWKESKNSKIKES